MLGTGFGQETRYLSTALAADGHSVYVYTASVNIKTDFYDPRLPQGKSEPVHVVPVLNVEHQLDGFNLLIALYNPEYISQAAVYYDKVFEGVKPKRKIGYFVHECRWVPSIAGPVFYNYKGDYDLVMTTPAQDLWGHHEKYPDKVHFIPHMIDTAHFSGAPSSGSGSRSRERLSRKYITAVMTNNNWRKRWDFVVEALAQSLSRGVFWKDWRFVASEPQGLFRFLDMMTSASQYDSLHEEPRSKDQPKPNVEVGPADDIREVYWRTRALLNPTTGEAFSLPIAEALAAGVPYVVATRLPELEELYGDALTYIESHTWLMPDGSYQKMPSFDGFLTLLMKIIEGEADEISPDKRAAAVEKFDIAKVYPAWKALIEGRANERETSQQINKWIESGVRVGHGFRALGRVLAVLCPRYLSLRPLRPFGNGKRADPFPSFHAVKHREVVRPPALGPFRAFSYRKMRVKWLYGCAFLSSRGANLCFWSIVDEFRLASAGGVWLKNYLKNSDRFYPFRPEYSDFVAHLGRPSFFFRSLAYFTLS